MRGIPGAGKSRWVLDNLTSAEVVSADHWYVRNGSYQFDLTELPDAHRACMKKFLAAIRDGRDVVIDNTGMCLWELACYVMPAAASGYDVTVVEVRCDPQIAADRNVHGCPTSTVLRMAKHMEAIPSFWPCKVEIIHSNE